MSIDNIFENIFDGIFDDQHHQQDSHLSLHDRAQAAEAAKQFGISDPKLKQYFVNTFLQARRQRNMLKAGVFNQ